MNDVELLFSLIRSEICNIDLSEEIKNDLASEQINRIYELSERHNIVYVVASVLSKVGLDDGISRKLQNELMKAIYFDAQREYTLQKISSIFEEAKIPYIPLKGVVICQYYPETWMRSSCDIDILVGKKDIDVAIKLLCGDDFKCIQSDSIYDYTLVSINGVHVELHFTLQQLELPKADKVLENVWQNVQLKQGFSYCYEMNHEMFMLYHLAHMARHLLHGGCGVRSFIDLWLLENKLCYDKEKFNSLLIEAGLLEFWNISCALAKEWMEGLSRTQKTEVLAEYVLDGGTYGTVKNSAKVHAGNGGNRLGFFLNLAFPPRANLKYPYLFPLYYIRRCLRIFQKSKRDKVINMISTRNHVTETESDVSRNMLKQLGLLDHESL